MPIQILPREPSLAALLGAGISKGLATGLEKRIERKGKLEEALALQKAKAVQDMTQYQALSTKLRAEDQKRKIHSALSAGFLKLADPFMRTPGVLPEDALPLSNMAYNIMETENMAAPQAMQEALSRYQTQRSELTEANLPKFKASKAETQKKEVINSLKERNVNNTHLINKELTAKNWPTRERKDIFKELKVKPTVFPKIIEPEKAEPIIAEKAKPTKLKPMKGYTRMIDPTTKKEMWIKNEDIDDAKGAGWKIVSRR